MAALGIVAGGVVYMALFGLGLLQILVAAPIAFAIVKTLGALYLAYLGTKLLWSAIRGVDAKPSSPIRLGNPFVQGLITNTLNPKVALFYLAALPQFTGTGPDAALRGTVMIGIHYAMGAVFLISLALLAGRIREYQPLRAIGRWLEGLIGVIFLALAGRLLVEHN